MVRLIWGCDISDYPSPPGPVSPPGTALVSGAAGGIGRAVTAVLLRAGYAVGALDTTAAGLDSLVADQAPTDRDRVLPLVADVRQRAEVDASIEKLVATFGEPTAVVLGAGVIRPGQLPEISTTDWQWHLDVNATGTFHLLQAVAPLLTTGSSVVLIGSNAASVPRFGMGAYAASKAAAEALVRCAALEFAASGVRCNIVEPGSTDTKMQRDLWPDPVVGQAAAIDGDPATYRLGIPLGRIADPADVAELVAFLLSDRARQMTLQTVRVDGGASL